MKEFTRYEDTLLIVSSGIYECDTLAALLERDEADIVLRYMQLNLNDIWSVIDDQLLKEHYANADPDTFAYLLRKTPKQIHARAEHHKLIRNIMKSGDLELWVEGELHETYKVYNFSKNNYRYMYLRKFAERVKNTWHVIIKLVGDVKEVELYNSKNGDANSPIFTDKTTQ